jgi:hypothetical protein
MSEKDSKITSDDSRVLGRRHTSTTKTRAPSSSSNPDFVNHAALLRLALRKHCLGINVEPAVELCRPEKNFWVFKATVYKSARCRGFVGYGDAHPGNVSPLIFNHAEMRMAETRAVNRELRKAYGVHLCALEELSAWSLSPEQIPVLRRNLHSRPPFQKKFVAASVCSPHQSGTLPATGRHSCGLGAKNPEGNSILQCIT